MEPQGTANVKDPQKSSTPDASVRAYYSLLRHNANMRKLWLGEASPTLAAGWRLDAVDVLHALRLIRTGAAQASTSVQLINNVGGWFNYVAVLALIDRLSRGSSLAISLVRQTTPAPDLRGIPV